MFNFGTLDVEPAFKALERANCISAIENVGDYTLFTFNALSIVVHGGELPAILCTGEI